MITTLILLALVLFAVYAGSQRLSGQQVLVLLLIVTTGIVITVSPGVAELVATRFGVGRGSDLVFYFALLFGLFIVANYYFRLKTQERQIIALTRALAIVTREVESLNEQQS